MLSTGKLCGLAVGHDERATEAFQRLTLLRLVGLLIELLGDAGRCVPQNLLNDRRFLS